MSDARDRLFADMREANQNLVMATLRAEDLAEEAEAARREVAASEERFRALVTTAAAFLFQASGDGHIQIDRGAWSELTGLDTDVEEAKEPGWGWLHAVHEEDRKRIRATWMEAVAGARMYTAQFRLRGPDGSYTAVAIRVVPLLDGDQVREWAGMLTDISERVRLDTAREQFIAILGHDLRNPLNAIQVSAELLMGAPEASTRACAARMARSARRMDAMIRDLLDFARGRLGDGIPVHRQPCDLGRVAGALVREM
ncbi:MAG TPA: histidine kinase dimerization/phospho-acceptor domain-containing protein, partial [Kofleriaceae bacterium]|nr:histidine kinase dimerization/phospho-acceptor domain-containing protein [Kofleriaceae bacterium]